MPAHDSSQCELIDQLAEEFAARFRRGERPSLQEYIDKYPELADDIRLLFPALVEMERIKDAHDEAAQEAVAIPRAEMPPLRQVGDYRIVREVGRGGMGVVYEAEQVSLGRRVALKVLPPNVSVDRQSLERFRREARSAAKLHHTNIVPVFEVGQDNDTFYYAMQFIQGQSLDQIIGELRHLRTQASPSGKCLFPEPSTQGGNAVRCGADHGRPAVDQLAHSLLTGRFQVDREAALVIDGTEDHISAAHADDSSCPITVNATASAVLPGQTELSSVRTDRPHYFESVARIAWQTAHALAYAHARGVIHRDIKPSNLLLDTAGVVWITDFGLAKTRDNSLTNTGDVVGTLRYMSPERFKGEVDERADVYGLGLTLYEMLTLRPAFDARDRLRLIDDVKSREPSRPRALDRRIPRDLETIVLKATHKEAKRRYQSAEEMAEDLRRFLADEPIRARRTSQVERLRLWGRRNPAVASLLSAVFLLLLCLTVGSIVAAYRLNEKREALEAAEADSTEKLYQSLVAQAQASHFSRRIGQRFDTLDAVRKAAELVRERHMPEERLDDLRNLATSALVLPDFRTLRTWEGFPGGSKQWDTDDSMRRYARSDWEGGISLRWIDTDDEIARLEGWRHEFFVHFSPGGRFLLAEGGGRFRVWDVSTAPPPLVQEGELHGFAFYPDGRHLLATRRDGSMSRHDLENPKQKPVFLFAHHPPVYRLAFDPTGDRLAASVPGTVQILDAKTGKLLSSLPQAQPGHLSAWHPSGNYLALVGLEGEIHIWDLKRTKKMTVLKGYRNGGINLAFTPDGDRLLSSGWEGMVRLWDWRTGRQVLQQPGGSNLRCRADGRLLIHEDSRLSLVEVKSGKEYRSFVQQSNAGKDVAYWGGHIHPEGRLLAVNMSDGDRFFDLETGEELGCLPQSGNHGFGFQGKEALLTNRTAGLFRWPIQMDKAKPNCWRIGPPKLLHGGTHLNIHCDKKGSVIGQAARSGAFVVRPGKGSLFLGPHADVRSLAISTDGKYAATFTHTGDEGVKVWDTETGRMLVRVPLGAMSSGLFSPDGKWLAVCGSRGKRLLKVGTWEEHPIDLGFPIVFSADGSLLASVSNPCVIRLLEPDTLRELVRLEDPNQDKPSSLAFTPDGCRLVDSSDNGRCIHVWDLRAIRTQLAELGLDWDMPPLPPSPPPSPEPLQVQIDMGNIRQIAEAAALVQQATRHILANKHADALAALRKAVKIAPSHAAPHNNLAWLLLTGPKELRDPAQALPEARKAVELAPDQFIYRNTLGVALYRNDKFADAVLVLERSLREGKGQVDAFDLFFLAMCHHRLGAAAKAKDYRDRAADWFAEHKGQLSPGWLEELTAFQAEADAVLAQPLGQQKK